MRLSMEKWMKHRTDAQQVVSYGSKTSYQVTDPLSRNSGAAAAVLVVSLGPAVSALSILPACTMKPRVLHSSTSAEESHHSLTTHSELTQTQIKIYTLHFKLLKTSNLLMRFLYTVHSLIIKSIQLKFILFV